MSDEVWVSDHMKEELERSEEESKKTWKQDFFRSFSRKTKYLELDQSGRRMESDGVAVGCKERKKGRRREIVLGGDKADDRSGLIGREEDAWRQQEGKMGGTCIAPGKVGKKIKRFVGKAI